jgi:NADH:ubiquinone reductase (H+-translocating)
MAEQQTQVVVIGAGYAGLLATVRLAGKLRRQPVRITPVKASDVFVERLPALSLAGGNLVICGAGATTAPL